MGVVTSLMRAINARLPGRIKYMIWQLKLFFAEKFSHPAWVQAVRAQRTNCIARLRNKDRLSVAFIVFRSSMWKYDTLYHLLDQDTRFDPFIVVVPEADLREGEARWLYHQTLSEMSLLQEGYRVEGAILKDGSIPAPEADILFYTTPYDSLLPPNYHVHRNAHRYTCYASYGYTLENKRHWYSDLNHRLFATFFVATDEIAHRYRRYMGATADNAIVVGPTIYDELRKKMDERKEDPDRLPLVIIAPHHSIEKWGYALSNFLRLSDFYLSLPARYAGRLRFAFKPHPHLKQKLEAAYDWGRLRTEAYYQFWAQTPGCSLELGAYTSVFAESAAMIHDCSAFAIEYLLTGHPALFVRRNGRLPGRLNAVARSAFALHAVADTPQEILVFLDAIARQTPPGAAIQEYNAFLEAALPLGQSSSVAEAMHRHLVEVLCQ